MAVVKATKFHDLRITAESPTDAKLALDGFQLRGVTEYRLVNTIPGATRLELTIYVQSINADAELLRKLLEGS